MGAPGGACGGLHSAINVFAMLPLDTVNSDGVFCLASAPWFSRALHLLARTGVSGVAVDVWVSGRWAPVGQQVAASMRSRGARAHTAVGRG
jgi:hypothetical protein